MNCRFSIKVVLLLAAIGICSAAAQSVWGPAQGRLWLTPVIQGQGYGTIWRGPNQRRLPDQVTQITLTGTAEYGLTNNITVDLSGGFTRVHTSGFGPERFNSGMADLLFGIRRRVYTPSRNQVWLPAVSLRAGGVIGGTYDPNTPYRAGVAASGADFTVLLGTGPTEHGFGTYGDIGIRARTHPAPAEYYGSGGVYQQLWGMTWSGGYRHKNSLSGPNFNDPGFAYPALKEVRQTIEGGVGIRGPGRHYYQLFIAKTVRGRNTGRALIAGIAVTFRL